MTALEGTGAWPGTRTHGFPEPSGGGTSNPRAHQRQRGAARAGRWGRRGKGRQGGGSVVLRGVQGSARSSVCKTVPKSCLLPPGPPQRSRASMASWWALATWRWVADLLSLSFPEHPVASLRWVLSVAGGSPGCLPHVLGLWQTFPVTVGSANRKWWRQSRLRGREAGPAAEAQGVLGMGSPTGGGGMGTGTGPSSLTDATWPARMS